MKVVVILTLLIVSAGAEKFSFEKNIQKDFQSLREKFKTIGVDLNFLHFYRSLRFIEKEKYKNDCSKKNKSPWNIYSPGPLTWIKWEIGNDIIQKMSERKVKALTVTDLSQIHKTIISHKNANLYDSLLLKMGLSKLGKYKKFGNPNILWNVDKSVVSNLVDPGIQSKILKGPHIKIADVAKLKENRVGIVYFYEKFENVGPALEELLGEINSYVNSFEDTQKLMRVNENYNYPLNLSPIQFVAYVQKKYISIHPFPDGQGRMSRMIQDYLMNLFDLPYILGGYLQEDMSTGLAKYMEETQKNVRETIKKLKVCWEERMSGNISRECQQIYRIEENDCEDLQRDKLDVYYQIFNSCSYN